MVLHHFWCVSAQVQLLRTLDDIEEELRPLDEVITSKLIPSIVGSQLSEVERSLVSLPVRLGGVGIESNHRLPLLVTNTLDLSR